MGLFYKNMIFDDMTVNQACDAILSILDKDGGFPADIALTGKAAFMLQDGIVESVNNIVFAVADYKKYYQLVNGLKDKGFVDVYKYRSFTEFKFETATQDVFFEIWIKDPLGVLVDYKGISLIHKDNIDSNLLQA